MPYAYPSVASRPVLIIDDSDDDVDATKRAFIKCGAIKNPLYRCANGQDALDFLLHQGCYSDPSTAPRPAIILLDLNMPGMDGRQFLARVKSDDSLKRIPVLVLTTSDNDDDIDYCYAQGANTYVKKPFDWSSFCKVMQRLKDHWLDSAILPQT